jgi:hypothetical protein
MTARALAFVVIAAAVVGCGPSVNPGAPTITGQVGGAATYQTIVGAKAQVHLIIRDFDGQVPDLVLAFVGQSNWLVEHRSITNDFSICRIITNALDCGAFSPGEYGNVILTGVASRPGVSHYTLGVWSKQDGHLVPIHAADGSPLVMRWVEVVNAAKPS